MSISLAAAAGAAARHAGCKFRLLLTSLALTALSCGSKPQRAPYPWALGQRARDGHPLLLPAAQAAGGPL